MCSKVVNEKLMSINSNCALLEITGEKTIDFLNNLIISDLKELTEDEFHYTALCNPKGRIISSLWIQIINLSRIQLICPKNMLNYLNNFFNMRKFRLKLEIIELHNFIHISNNKITVAKTDANLDSVSLPNEVYMFHFNQNLPWIDAEFTEKFIPQHVNLDQHKNIMSFTKGCYPGQEIVARIKYLGKIKKRMLLLNNKSKNLLLKQAKTLQVVSPIIENELNKYYYIQAIERIN